MHPFMPFFCSSYSGPGQGHNPTMKKHFCNFTTSRLCLYQARDHPRCSICFSAMKTPWIWACTLNQFSANCISVTLQFQAICVSSATAIRLAHIPKPGQKGMKKDTEKEWKEDRDQNNMRVGWGKLCHGDLRQNPRYYTTTYNNTKHYGINLYRNHSKMIKSAILYYTIYYNAILSTSFVDSCYHGDMFLLISREKK